MKSPTGQSEITGSKVKNWRRAWDLNPRYFRMPVFKTGALGRYASPPWANLPLYGGLFKIRAKKKVFLKQEV